MSLPVMHEAPLRDEILVEVRTVREELAARFDYDVDRLFDEAKRLERTSSRPRLAASPKRLVRAESA